MGLKCLLGIHAWNGCKCTRCGKTRDKEHDWNRCRCSRCGAVRLEGHDFVKDCEKCGICC